jgi:hypothetical protein
MGLDLPKKFVSITLNLYFCGNKYKDMSWRGFFEGIESFFVDVAFLPFDYLRSLDTVNWFLSNIVTWILMTIGFVAFFYWMVQLNKFNVAEEEDRTSTSHSYLG